MDHIKLITRKLISEKSAKGNNRLCVFSHYDKDNKIDDYVAHYVKELAYAGCDIIFVSNCEEIEEKYTDKILPHVNKLIMRKNKGYDMAGFITGFYEADNLQAYTHIIFANDSVYGPFYPLKKVFHDMEKREFDVWGISDNISPKYHIQNYFTAYKISNQAVRQLLDDIFSNYFLSEDKEYIIKHYEIGVSQQALANDLKIGAFCPQADLVNFENLNRDEKILSLIKESISLSLPRKYKVSRFSSNSRFRFDFFKRDFAINYIPQYSSWYTAIEYFNSPFISAALLRELKMLYYHNFLYRDVIAKKYPDYDLSLIEGHLDRVRNYDLNLLK